MPQDPIPSTLFVTKIVAGNGIEVTPESGTGIVTVQASGGTEDPTAITGGATPFPISAQAAATATSAGGEIDIAGAPGGSTSGAGGKAKLTGGAGTAGNAAGGEADLTGGAGQGSAAGGAAKVAGGLRWCDGRRRRGRPHRRRGRHRSGRQWRPVEGHRRRRGHRQQWQWWRRRAHRRRAGRHRHRRQRRQPRHGLDRASRRPGDAEHRGHAERRAAAQRRPHVEPCRRDQSYAPAGDRDRYRAPERSGGRCLRLLGHQSGERRGRYPDHRHEYR